MPLTPAAAPCHSQAKRDDTLFPLPVVAVSGVHCGLFGLPPLTAVGLQDSRAQTAECVGQLAGVFSGTSNEQCAPRQAAQARLCNMTCITCSKCSQLLLLACQPAMCHAEERWKAQGFKRGARPLGCGMARRHRAYLLSMGWDDSSFGQLSSRYGGSCCTMRQRFAPPCCHSGRRCRAAGEQPPANATTARRDCLHACGRLQPWRVRLLFAWRRSGSCGWRPP